MSETVEPTAQATSSSSNEIKLSGLYAIKLGMSTVYNEAGEAVPVTILKYNNCFVTQVKTQEKDGYTAVQLGTGSKKAKNSNASEKGHFKNTGFENGAAHVHELRQTLPDGITVGQRVALDSIAKGDVVKLTARSKGKGFQGVIGRHGHHGGPAAHGSGFHRRPGSMGCRTWPGRVKPGRKLPGHQGFRNITIKNVEIVDVIPSESVFMVRGPVPGAYNTLVKIVKEA
jgi:large subunit ribosomal protein L3